MGSNATDEPDLLHPNPLIWLEFRLLNPPAPEPPRSPSALTTFPLFNSLPFEIRQKIYAEALIPRTILLTCNTSESTVSTPLPSVRSTLSPSPHVTPPFHRNVLAPIRPQRRPCFSSPPAPPLLHVSREARSFAQRHYVPSFGYHISSLHTSTPLRLSPRVYFDFDRDALLLAGDLEPRDVHGFHGPMAYFLDKDECARVKRVACHADALRSTVPPVPQAGVDAVTTYYPGPQLGDADALPPAAPVSLTDAVARHITYPEPPLINTHSMGMAQEVDPEVIFVMLSHVLDRFSSVGTLPVPFDESKSKQRSPGGTGPLSWEEGGRDVIQKIWDGWVLGVTDTRSPLRGKRIPLVTEAELEKAWDLECY